MQQVRWTQQAAEAPYGIDEAAGGERAAAAWRPANVAAAP
jgi:hypothetical protein